MPSAGPEFLRFGSYLHDERAYRGGALVIRSFSTRSSIASPSDTPPDGTPPSRSPGLAADFGISPVSIAEIPHLIERSASRLVLRLAAAGHYGYLLDQVVHGDWLRAARAGAARADAAGGGVGGGGAAAPRGARAPARGVVTGGAP